jgi:uncharacterized protein (DUF2267 family)
MDYEEIVDRVAELDFIADRNTADAAVKAVWGVIASAVDEDTAREITDELPDPLTIERLRSHQVRDLRITSEAFIQEISTQFRLTPEQSSQLIERVIEAGEQAMDEKTLADLREALPLDLHNLV